MKALYHQHNQPPLECHVVKDHGNGTVDLSRTAGGKAFITCILAHGDKAIPGRATKVELADKKPVKPVPPES